MHKDSYTRSLFKALSWRVSGFLVTAVIVWGVSGQWSLALTVGAAEAVSKIFFFMAHEKLWEKIRFGRVPYQPAVIWLTGLSGAGKTTLGGELVSRLRAQGFKVEHLDGDQIRDLFPSTGFTREARLEHVKRVGFLASRLEQAGVIVVASLISPYKESRDFVRAQCKRFVEVHVSTPLEVCERRDPKGLYGKARRGEIRNFTGIGDPYEIPENPELTLDTSHVSVEVAVEKIEKHLGASWF